MTLVSLSLPVLTWCKPGKPADNSHPFVTAIVLLGLLLAVLTIRPAGAQEVTGTIQGTVVSAETGPEPEVRVTLSGPNLQGTRETRTDHRGFFQFLAVPPGRYTLALTRMGLRAMEVPDVVVELGHTAAVPKLTMAIQPVEMEPIVVRGTQSAMTIDPVHTAGGGTLNARDYEALPVDRDYKSIITVLPGANSSYRGDPVNVGGGTGLENQYYIDGVNVTDTKTAGRATSLPYNFVRAVDVKTGGYEAQYGRALGAVVNALTYSGTNDFEMNVFGFAQPGALAMDPAQAPVVVEQEPITYDFGARLGGPMVQDRLWYSAAVNPRADLVDKEITGHGFYPDRTETIRFATKLAWQASSKTNVELSVFGDPTQQDNVSGSSSGLFGGLTTIDAPDPLLYQTESGGVVASLRATVAPSQNFMLRTSLARQWDQYSESPTGSADAYYFDYVEGRLGGGHHTFWDEDRGRTNLALQGTLVLPAHTLTAGVDYQDARVFSSYDAEFIARLDSTVYAVTEEAYSGTFHNRSPALYVQDNWRLTDRFTLNPGVRWSAQYLVGQSGNTNQSITDEWQPRLGFSWQVGAEGTQRVFGSYGRFYQTIPNNIAILWYVDYLYEQSFYSSDPRQGSATPDSVLDGSTYEESIQSIDDLHAEHFDEFTLGYERLLGEQTKLTLRATRRELRSSFQWGLDPTQYFASTNSPWVLGTPGKGDFDFLPPPKREYTALEVGAEGAWRRIRYRTSYVVSRTWGNYPGLFNSDFNSANPGQVTTFWMPNQAANSAGYLPNDRTHVFKLSGVWDGTFGVDVGTFVTVESGAPINEFAAGPWFGPLSPSFLAQRGTAGRTPTLWNVDLRFGYDVPITPGPRWRVQMDLLHVGNPREATQVDETRYMTVDVNGNPATPNPNYKKPLAYQPPMAVRLGVEATF